MDATFKDIKVTLYDVFGYFIPGAVLLSALMILMWTLITPETPLHFPDLSGAEWIAVVAVSYICGHVAQGVANLLSDHSADPNSRFASAERRLLDPASVSECRLPQSVVDAAQRRAVEKLGFSADQLDFDSMTLFNVCDRAIAKEDYGDRDVYIYREGFYRGLTVSFGLLALAILIRAGVAILGDKTVKFSGLNESVKWPALSIVFAVSVVATWLCFRRFQHFGEYRVRHAVFGFAMASTAKPSPPEQNYSPS